AALFPAAAVLVMGYAEALFMALSVGAFLALRTRRWEVAAGLGLLAGLCRPLGVVLVVPAAIEAWREWGSATAGERLRRAGGGAGPAPGAGGYLVWPGR